MYVSVATFVIFHFWENGQFCFMVSSYIFADQFYWSMVANFSVAPFQNLPTVALVAICYVPKYPV